MKIQFDAYEAEALIYRMQNSIAIASKEIRQINGIIMSHTGWDDVQSKQFEKSLSEIRKNLIDALSVERDYIESYKDRVNELMG